MLGEESALGVARGGSGGGWSGEDVVLGQGAPHEFLALGEAGDGECTQLVDGLLGGATPKAPAQGLDEDLRQALLVHPGDGRADQFGCLFFGGVGLDLMLTGGCEFAKLPDLIGGEEVGGGVRECR